MNLQYRYLSLHAVPHTDENGELFDVTYYCSDWCARQDSDYQGWYGGVELGVDVELGSWTCPECGETIELDEYV